jgi:uncharacterized protein
VKKRNPVFGALLILVGVLFLTSGLRSATDDRTRLLTPTTQLRVELADDQNERTMGLSGREKLDDKTGMLFVFDELSSQNCFWMKDMKLTIDMVWLDEQKNVVTITEGVGPETYPQTFCPAVPAKYGLEIGSNKARQYGLEAGKSVKF